MKQFITPTGIIEVPEVANASEQPKIVRQFKPRMHANDRVRIKIGKKLTKDTPFKGTIHSLKGLKGLVKA